MNRSVSVGWETCQAFKGELASGDRQWAYIEMKTTLVASIPPFSNEAQDYGLLSEAIARSIQPPSANDSGWRQSQSKYAIPYMHGGKKHLSRRAA